MFSDRMALQIADAAKAAGISETGMLAIVEVETAGSPTEADNRTPTFLFERHIFYRELFARQPEKLQAAIKAGLAIPKWNKAVQYRDERTSAERMELLAKVKAVDEDCALRACSWGLPQIMGNECAEVGFPNAKAMVDYMIAAGVGGHINLMTRFLQSRNLISAIERGDWAYVALRYNGKGYAQNHYDTRLAAANKKWENKLQGLRIAGPVDHPEEELTRDEVKQIQTKLRTLNYVEVGLPDGKWGDKTGAAVWAFQKQHGLLTTGHLDADTRNALNDAVPRPVSPERENTTVDDLRQAGSTTIVVADHAEVLGKAKVAVGATVTIGTLADTTTSVLNSAQSAVDQANKAKGIVASVHDLLHPLFGHPEYVVVGVGLAGLGWFAIRYADRIKLARLLDHQTGVHAGPSGE